MVVSHGNPFRALVGGAYLAEGEAAVIEPRGKDGFVVIARVPQEEWSRLAAAGKQVEGAGSDDRLIERFLELYERLAT